MAPTTYTLAEMAKQDKNPLRAGVLMAYGEGIPFREFATFQSIDGSAYQYNTSTELPGVAFRGVNGSYTASTGVNNPQTESLKIAGGEIALDNFIANTSSRASGDLLGVQVEMQGLAMGKFLTSKFFNGDQAADPKEFDGMRRRVTGSQLIAAGSTSGGDALTTDMLDELIDAVHGGEQGKILCMNRWMIRKVNRLIRAAGQTFETISNEFGRKYLSYAGVPIVAIEEDHAGAQILGFTEANPGGGSAVGTSIYCLRFGVDTDVSFLQSAAGMTVSDLGELQTRPARAIRVEWYITPAVFNGKSVARLWGLKAA